jgi:DNA-binding winged helix-turn-helix (wHTH) protein
MHGFAGSCRVQLLIASTRTVLRLAFQSVISHRALLIAVWGGQNVRSAEYLWVFINQLRKKIEPDATPRYILTEPRVGYRFRPEKD